MAENRAMSTNHNKSDYLPWAEGLEIKKGQTVYHPYTHKKSKFEIDEYGRVIFTSGVKNNL